MTDEGTAQAQTEKTLVTITLLPTGEVKLTSPLIGDKTAMYGILETAKDMVRELHAPKVLQPKGNMLSALRMGNIGKH